MVSVLLIFSPPVKYFQITFFPLLQFFVVVLSFSSILLSLLRYLITNDHLLFFPNRSFYKHVLGNPVDYLDLEAIEPEIFKSLKQILNMSLEDLGLELTFSAESHIFGKHEVRQRVLLRDIIQGDSVEGREEVNEMSGMEIVEWWG